MTTWIRVSLSLLIVLIVCIVGLGVRTVSAHAATKDATIFVVMNTDETLPDGVFFRNSPSSDDTDRVQGHGVYKNDFVGLECYQWGQPVGSYANSLWYRVSNLTRPTVPATGQLNEGFLNAHYINDGKGPGLKDEGVPACQLNMSGSVFYTPFYNTTFTNLGWWTLPVQPMATVKIDEGQWNATPCSSSDGYLPSKDSNGLTIRTAGAWSLGRIGLLRALSSASDDQLRLLQQIIFYDPGDYGELSTSCDSWINASNILAHALQVNPSLHILILAGTVTNDQGNGYDYDSGVQNVYLSAIRGDSDKSSRTFICNYGLNHSSVYSDFNGLMSLMDENGPITTCPDDPLSNVPTPIAIHP